MRTVGSVERSHAQKLASSMAEWKRAQPAIPPLPGWFYAAVYAVARYPMVNTQNGFYDTKHSGILTSVIVWPRRGTQVAEGDGLLNR